MSTLGLATDGYYGGGAGSGGPLTAPTISNIEPTQDIEPGEPGAFSASFRVARLTPVEFDLSDLVPGSTITISVRLGDRNETYTALDVSGAWLWPFDVSSDNEIGSLAVEPCHVRMLPRGGWPPTLVTFTVAAAKQATT